MAVWEKELAKMAALLWWWQPCWMAQFSPEGNLGGGGGWADGLPGVGGVFDYTQMRSAVFKMAAVLW